ncbi:MAG: hypothetical protein L6Q66_05335, partial [Bacteroidia bacterium]|nr:hypothetical protein [Bacteroidia bacterium]
DKKNEVAKKCIENANGAFNSFPKDLRQSIKDELGKNIDAYTKTDLAGFQVLIDKLKSIIDETEVLHKEEVATINTKPMPVKTDTSKAVATKAKAKKTVSKETISKRATKKSKPLF